MKKSLSIATIALTIAFISSFAGAFELLTIRDPDQGPAAQLYYDSEGRLCDDRITSPDVMNWLGAQSNDWYFTTGEGRPSNYYIGYQPFDLYWFTCRLNDDADGCSLGIVSSVDFSNFHSLTLSCGVFIVSDSLDGYATCSFWYETKDGNVVLLAQDTIHGELDASLFVDPFVPFSYTVYGAQYQQMMENGTGRLYFIVGFGNNGTSMNTYLTDLSLTGAIPEPVTVTLGLAGLAALASKRRKPA